MPLEQNRLGRLIAGQVPGHVPQESLVVAPELRPTRACATTDFGQRLLELRLVLDLLPRLFGQTSNKGNQYKSCSPTLVDLEWTWDAPRINTLLE